MSSRKTMDLLYFTRGRGRGHALPDMAIMNHFCKFQPSTQWTFVSYATGGDTFKKFGCPCIDLDLPEDNQFIATLDKCYALIAGTRPACVISHEEPAVILAAHLLGIPSLFITDWFYRETIVWMQPLQFAKQILFLERQCLFDEPSYVSGKVRYLGPIVRDLVYTQQDRGRARAELGIDADSTLISCVPGGWAVERRAPLEELLTSSFRLLGQHKNKMLVWVAGADAGALKSRLDGISEIRVESDLFPLERLLVASDVVITKGNRVTTMEASYLGVPSISLSYGLNEVEDVILPRIQSNLVLRVKGLTPAYLANCIDSQLRQVRAGLACNGALISPEQVARSLDEFVRAHREGISVVKGGTSNA